MWSSRCKFNAVGYECHSYLDVKHVVTKKLVADGGQAAVDLVVVSNLAPSRASAVAAEGVASKEEQQQGHDGRELELHGVSVCCVRCLMKDCLLVWMSFCGARKVVLVQDDVVVRLQR